MTTKTVGPTRTENLLVEGLTHLLADTYFLYLKGQNFHWNVTGPRFLELHSFFEKEYQTLAEAVDGIAERIRALGSRAPGSFSEFRRLSSLEETEDWLSAEEMIRSLLKDNEVLIGSMRQLLREAEACQDIVSIDLVTERISQQEACVWKLRSLLE